ncbi:RNA-binding protein [Mesorhizobium sp. BAC0120]|uniref:RNA-binding protein n=1 Tax=Mesorhizobium sp. BAC0120 TaxID=3090670 RepID=UPI00298CB4D4|nr:RNA-binding protein [Mesorhizobium sp. BAC0120]MDW6025212.1 RNA-binding protein [Mesorhizobium sp. BAC0120]
MNDRTCIVTRKAGAADDLIRFVVGPDSALVPDLKGNLPGRGCWVTADRLHVDRAAQRKLFARALKAEVKVPADLGEMVDRLLAKGALGALGLARKAGAVAMGAAKVEAAVRSGEALAVLHAFEASPDGVRKITQARRATALIGGPQILAYKLFSEAEIGLALGGANVIHAAVLAGDAGRAALRRLVALDRYRGGTPDEQATGAAVADEELAAEDTE